MIKFCKKCNAETDRYACGRCKPCQREHTARYRAAHPSYDATYRAAHKEKYREYAANWCALNKDKLRVSQAKYYAENSAKIGERKAKYHAKNRDKMLKAMSRWYAANRNKQRAYMSVYHKTYYAANSRKVLAYITNWKRENTDKTRVYHHNRRSRARTSGKLSPFLASRLFKLQKGMCVCCNQPLGNDYHMDHIMPLALGGQNIDDNIQLLRAKCNMQKSAKHPVDFMRSKGFML